MSDNTTLKYGKDSGPVIHGISSNPRRVLSYWSFAAPFNVKERYPFEMEKPDTSNLKKFTQTDIYLYLEGQRDLDEKEYWDAFNKFIYEENVSGGGGGASDCAPEVWSAGDIDYFGAEEGVDCED